MNRTRSLVTAVGLACATLILTGMVVASAHAQTSGAANQIVIRPQETGAGQIVVDTVIAAQDGWLVVYSDTTFSTASVLGWVPVHKGVNTNLKVNINSEVVESTPVLWAVLHVDRGEIGQLELPLIDGTVQENGQTVMVAFGTQAPSAAETQPAPVSAPPAPAATGATTAPPSVLPPAGASQSLAGLALAAMGVAALTAGVILSRRQYR